MSGFWGEAAADCATCLRFFSRLPVPASWPERPFGLAVRLLPVAAIPIAAATAVPYGFAAAAGLPPAMAALAGIAAGLLASGALHEDGLADMADGFGGGRSVARKLEIMRDSRIGTYGVVALLVALGWRVSALSALLDRTGSPVVAACLVLAAGAATRALALLPLAILPPARLDGLGRGVGVPGRRALATCFSVAAAIGLGGPVLAGAGSLAAILACALAIAAAAGVARLAWRQVGGHTGDIAGATQQVAEAAYLLGLVLVLR